MKKASILLLIFFLSFLSSCQKKGNKDPKNRIVNIAFKTPIRSFDPRISNEYPSVHVMNMIYEGLMRLGPNGEILPGVAESVKVSEDQMIYTFYLRDSVWSNGDPVTAYDFEYAWKKSVNPLYAQAGAFTFYAIKNVSACLKKKVSVDEVGIRALDEKTLEVELEYPAPYFLSLCACTTYSPIHKKFDLEDPHWASQMSDHFVMNGPFVLKGWKKSVEIYLEKNPKYWDSNAIKIPGVRIQVIQDTNTQCFLFEKRELDWIGHPFNSLPLDATVDRYEKGELEMMDAYGVFWFFINTEKPPFNNKNFRKAVAYAINRQEIVDHILQLGQIPAMRILHSDLALQKESYFEDCNVELAKQCFQKALVEMGTTLEQLPSVILNGEAHIHTSLIDQAIQEQLRKTLGLEIEISQLDWPVHFNRISRGDYQIGEMSWTSWLRDPIYMLDTFRYKSSAINMSRWEHPYYQELLEKSDFELDPVKRKEYLRKAEELLMEEMPVIPICFNKIYFLRSKKLKGVYVSSLREIDFRYAYFEEE